MRKVRAIQGHTYGGKFRKIGEVYEAPNSHCKLMVLTKNAEFVEIEQPKPEPKPKAKRPYVRRNQTAAPNKSTYSTKVLEADT